MKTLKKTKFIFLVIICIVCILYIGLVIFNYNNNKTMMEELTKNNQVNIVEGYKKKIDEWLLSKKRLIASTAEFISTMSSSSDYEKIQTQLAYVNRSGDFRSVYAGYENDDFISGIYWLGSSDYFASKRPWYLETKEANSMIVTTPYIDSDLKDDVISIATPILRDGKFIGVLSSDLILDVIAKDILTINLPVDGFAFLLNKRGNILVSPKGFSSKKCEGCEAAIKAILQKKDKSNTLSYSYEGKKYLLTYEFLENTDWIFATVLDEENIFKELTQKLFINVLMALGLVLFGLIMFFISMLMSKMMFKHRQLLDSFAYHSIQALAMVNLKGNSIFMNTSYKKLFDLEHINNETNINDIPHVFSNTSLDVSKKMKTLITSVLSQKVEQTSETFINDKQTLSWRVQVTGILDAEQNFEGAMITVSDISHEYFLEKREQEHERIMIQHGKMAALGEMVGAITHQWRQPLAALLVMMGNMKFQVTDKMISEERLISNFEKASEIIRFMEETLQSFKEFYKVNANKECFDVADTVQEVVNIMDPMARVNNIDLKFNYEYDQDYRLFSHSNHLKQVIVNLISNAKDAIIEKRDDQDELGHITINLEKSTHYKLIIEDDGCGIDTKFKEKLFKPLQTTKGIKGTGNGLYFCRLLIDKKLNGEIKISSYKNPTRFEIILPFKEVNHGKECS